MTKLRQADPGGWVSLFPVTAAWTAACQQAARAWIEVSEQMGQATLEMAKVQAEGFAQALSMGLEAAGSARVAGDLMGAGLEAATSESEQFAQAALHMVETLGPGDKDYVPLPE